jgi:CheY-like chemotaxis protein
MITGTETILVVDDETSIRKLVRDTLEPLGYIISEAPNGEKALEYYRKNKGVIDLLFTDVVMPKMTGKKLAEYLQKDNPNLKVLYMSGYTDNVIAHKGVLDKDVHFLNKPLVPSVLARKIREVLEK